LVGSKGTMFSSGVGCASAMPCHASLPLNMAT
jgi:hypothetical protein